MSLPGSITTSDYLPYEDFQRLVKSLYEEKQYFWVTYCTIAFCTGLRYSDLKKLTWGDVLNKKSLIIKAQKTKKTHVIPLSVNTSKKLADLHKLQGSPLQSEYILQSPFLNGKPLTIQQVNRMLKIWKYKYELNIDNFSSHTFRKTFGRYVYETHGASDRALLYLNQIFRHSNIETTRIYLGIRKDEISEIFQSLDF